MDEFGLLDRFVRLFPRIITTPHILTEVSNLGGRVQDSDLGSFRARLGQEIELCDERNCEAKFAAHGPLFLKLGLTDAATARIAEEGLLVLTDDLPLAGALGKTGIDVLNFNWLRPLAWRR